MARSDQTITRLGEATKSRNDNVKFIIAFVIIMLTKQHNTINVLLIIHAQRISE
jgi:hypothetical protein